MQIKRGLLAGEATAGWNRLRSSDCCLIAFLEIQQSWKTHTDDDRVEPYELKDRASVSGRCPKPKRHPSGNVGPR